MVWLGLPRRPTQGAGGSDHLKSRTTAHRARLVRMATNRAVLALRALLKPDLGGASTALTRHRSWEEWNKSAGLDREAHEGMENQMLEFYSLCNFEIPDGKRCYERLGRVEHGGYGRDSDPLAASCSSGQPVKGEVVPLQVENIGLPPPGTKTISLVEHCVRARHYFENFANEMLQHGGEEINEEERQRRANIKPYLDPALKKKSTCLALAERMWDGGSIVYTRECLAEIVLFTVFQRLNEDGSWRLRPVWDLRRVNLLFQKAPWASLASPGAMSELLVGDEIRRGRVVISAQGDVPNFFSVVATPPVLHPYFCFPTVRAREFYDFMAAKGRKVPVPSNDEQFLAVGVLPQGYSWSPYFAQSLLEELLCKPESPLADGALLSERRPCPSFLLSILIFWIYIDDFAVLKLVDMGMAEAEAQALSLQVREYPNGVGLDVHKEETGIGFESCVGIRMTSDPYRLRPAPMRLMELMAATFYMVSLGAAEVDALRRLVGLWTWNMLLVRPFYSCFHAVYRWINVFTVDGKAVRGRIKLWDTVIAEFTIAASLAPFLAVALENPFSPFAFEVDASETGYGLVQTKTDNEEVAQELQEGLASYWNAQMDKVAAVQDEVFSGGLPTVDISEAPLQQVVPNPTRRGKGLLELTTVDGEDLSSLVHSVDLSWAERWCPSRGARYDFRREGPQVRLLSRLSRQAFFLAVIHVPLGTFAAVKKLRSYREPLGCSTASDTVKSALKTESLLVYKLLELVWACLDNGVPIVVIHPRSSIFWGLRPTKLLAEQPGMVKVHLKGCVSCRGWTMMTNVAALRGLPDCSGCAMREEDATHTYTHTHTAESLQTRFVHA